MEEYKMILLRTAQQHKNKICPLEIKQNVTLYTDKIIKQIFQII